MAKYVQPNFIVDSSAAFKRNVTFDSSVYLKGVTHISSPGALVANTPYALVVGTIGSDVSIQSRQLGTMAWETSTNYYGKTQVDAIKVTIDASIIRIDASLNDTIDALTLFPTIGYVDGSLNAKVNKAGDTMTGTLVLAATGFTLDGQNITAIDTSTEAMSVLDTHIPTSAAVLKAINSAVGSGVTASNGLREVGQDIRLGGNLIEDTSINFNGFQFYFRGIGTGTGLNAIVQEGEALRTQQLGTMALETSTNYASKGMIDASFAIVWTKFGNVDTSLNGIWTKLVNVDTSLNSLWTKEVNQDSSINGLWNKFSSTDASIINLRQKDTDIDTSLNGIWTKFGYVDTSLAIFQGWQLSQDASIINLQNATVKAWNGLTTTNASVGLGGSLNIPTTITADTTNTLSLAGLVTSTIPNSYAVVQDSAGGSLKTRQLGSMAFETSTNYYSKGMIDASFVTVWTKFGNVDTSLSNLGVKDANIDTSLNGIWTKLVNIDTSIIAIDLRDTYQDASIASLALAQGNYVKKSGDTMSGPLVISTGGLVLTAGDVSIMNGDLYVSKHGHFGGNVTIDGSLIYTNIESINVSTNYIRLATGQTGTPPPEFQSGIIVARGSALPYAFIYDENIQTFRIGIVDVDTSTHYSDASTQAVATREDAPVAFGVPFWNNGKFRLDTSVGFTFTPGQGLRLPIATTQGSEMTALVWDGALVGSRDLGTMAFETSTNYYSKGMVDASFNAVWNKLGNVDSSLTALGVWVMELSTNKIDAIANTTSPEGTTYEIYSGEANNIAYIKRLKAGVGTTITQDSSTITIAVGGTSGVQKYRGTFNGTVGTSFAITATTHGLGTGPLTISVYESDEQVYTGINVNSSGDVNLTWSSGSLADASCKFIITG